MTTGIPLTSPLQTSLFRGTFIYIYIYIYIYIHIYTIHTYRAYVQEPGSAAPSSKLTKWMSRALRPYVYYVLSVPCTILTICWVYHILHVLCAARMNYALRVLCNMYTAYSLPRTTHSPLSPRRTVCPSQPARERFLDLGILTWILEKHPRPTEAMQAAC